MSKIQLDDVIIEIIGNKLNLQYDTSKYNLTVNSNTNNNGYTPPQKPYTYDSNISSLANQINQVESDNRLYGDK